jgi:hypothetical protein
MIQMAKKPEKKVSHGQQKRKYLPRKEQLSREEIQARITGIQTVLGELMMYAKEMELNGFDHLTVDGIQKLPNAKTLMQEFALNLRHAIGLARVRKGN